MVRLSTDLTQTRLVVLTEHVPEPLMLLTHPVLQVLHRADQLVDLQHSNSLMRLQVNLTVRGQTHQAGFQGLELHLVQTSQATSPGLAAVMVETPSRVLFN